MDYDVLAREYDRFNAGFDYAEYLARILPHLRDLPENPLALDCGCGTGTLMLALSRKGFDCSGVDLSPEMLDVAREKLSAEGIEPHLMCQSLSELDLYGAYHAVFSSMDTVNHLLDKRELKRFFYGLYNFVEPGGYFVFDLKEKPLFAPACQTDEDGADLLVLRRTFDGTYACQNLTVFREEGESYRRVDAEIWERWYDPAECRGLLKDAGFIPVKTMPYRGRKIIIVRRPLQ
ncbi:MAG: class I SAM-dependent methyltransferase [Clostridia bacterium]|nr:class I SAM-dependent methyltransferase [Clostridia bacterium]